jgi:hypothetical protein
MCMWQSQACEEAFRFARPVPAELGTADHAPTARRKSRRSMLTRPAYPTLRIRSVWAPCVLSIAGDIRVPDDPKKKGAADRKRVSQQPHEQRYQAKSTMGVPAPLPSADPSYSPLRGRSCASSNSSAGSWPRMYSGFFGGSMYESVIHRQARQSLPQTSARHDADIPA